MLGLYTLKNIEEVMNVVTELAICRVAHPEDDDSYTYCYLTQRASLNNRERELFDKMADALSSPSGMDDIIEAFVMEIGKELCS